MRIAVVDGQGGGIGRVIVEKIRKDLPEETEIIALGTNALATSLMLKAGANEGASGEAAIVYNVPGVDLIVGPVGIVLTNSMLGELTAPMAEAIIRSSAGKVLLPVGRNNVKIIGIPEEPLPHLVDALVKEIKKITEVA